MPEVKPSEVDSVANIKVVGVGGAGCNAVNRMREAGLTGVELIAINTDAQQLRSSKADVKLPLHLESNKGLGAGANPARGEKAGAGDRAGRARGRSDGGAGQGVEAGGQ